MRKYWAPSTCGLRKKINSEQGECTSVLGLGGRIAGTMLCSYKLLSYICLCCMKTELYSKGGVQIVVASTAKPQERGGRASNSFKSMRKL